jgi:hypothetical protein
MNISDNEIKNNIVVRSGFEYVEKMPLGFFDFDNENDKHFLSNNRGTSHEIKGTLKVKDYGFEPLKDSNGKEYSPEVYMVSRAKARPVLIFQDMEFCKQHHNNVFIIPIQSLVEPTLSNYKTKDEYVKAKIKYDKIKAKDEDVFNFYYFPKIKLNQPIKERVLVLSDARFVHKSLLFEIIKEDGLSENDLNEISIRMSKMLNIKKIDECKQCKLNCENCEYVNMFEDLKKIINRAEQMTMKKEA